MKIHSLLLGAVALAFSATAVAQQPIVIKFSHVVAADTPGLSFDRALELSAPHPLGDLSFDDCRVPASRRLGAEGDLSLIHISEPTRPY